MVEKTDFRGVINPVKAIPEAEQRELIAKYEPSEVYDLSKVEHETVIRQQRPPRAVVVSDAALLGEQRGYKPARFDSFLWFKGEIHKKQRGGFILEARTGLRSDRPKDWAVMRRTAEAMCGRLAQGAKSALNAKKGMKPLVLTVKGRQIAREEWTSKEHRTIDDAVARIKQRFKAELPDEKAPGRTKLYEFFGSPYAKRK